MYIELGQRFIIHVNNNIMEINDRIDVKMIEYIIDDRIAL